MKADCSKLGTLLWISNEIYKWHKRESKEELRRWHYIMHNSLQTVMKPLPQVRGRTIQHRNLHKPRSLKQSKHQSNSTYPNFFAGIQLLNMQYCKQMLCHRAVWRDDCTGILNIMQYLMYCSQRVMHCKERDREFVLIHKRRSGNVGFWTLHAEQWCSSFYDKIFSIYIRILVIR